MVRVLSFVVLLVLAGCASNPEAFVPPAPGQTLAITIEGAPASFTPRLVAAFAAAAQDQDYVIALPGTSPLALRGYVSVVGSSAGTLLIYVIDVTDDLGTRLTRITGQATSTRTSGDPWQVVIDDLLAGAVTRTFQEFAVWRAGNALGV